MSQTRTAKKQDQLDAGRWDDVRLFLAIARSGSLGAAARRLGLDISTVSRRLAGFEETLGVQLFERGKRGLVATRAAESLQAPAEAMEAAHARLTREASDVESIAEGVVRISIPPGMADVFLAPLLVPLRAKYPRIVIEVDASIRVLDLTRHEADLALRSIRPQSAELVMTKLTDARSIAMGSPALVKSLGRVRDWNDATWIAWDHDLAALPDAKWLARHVDRSRIVLRTSHYATQLVSAAAGLGLALFPEPYLRTHALAPARYDAALAGTTDAWSQSELWLVGHRATREVPRVAAVWTFLVDALRRQLAPKRAPTA